MKLRFLMSALVAISMASSTTLAMAKEKTKIADCGGEKCHMPKEMQEAMEKISAVNENHKLLDYMVGSWTAESKLYMVPEKPPEVAKGKSTTKPIMGGRFYQSDYSSTMMGKPFKGRAVSGYDNTSKKFTNSWIDNLSTHMVVSKGSYDPKSKTFTYTGIMDDCMKPGKKVEFKEVIKIIDKDKHVFKMFESRDGKEAMTMEITYTREKASS